MKLDVEGWELHALRGAEVTLRTDRPNMILEFSGDDPLGRALVAHLQARDYVVFDNFFRVIDDEYFITYADFLRQMGVNITCVHKTKLGQAEIAARRAAVELDRLPLEVIQRGCRHNFRIGYV